MKKLGKRIAIVTVIIAILTIGFTAVVLADKGNGASYGECSEGACPGLNNCWGKDSGGVKLRAGYGETSCGAGHCLQNCWGKNKS